MSVELKVNCDWKTFLIPESDPFFKWFRKEDKQIQCSYRKHIREEQDAARNAIEEKHGKDHKYDPRKVLPYTSESWLKLQSACDAVNGHLLSVTVYTRKEA